MTERHHSVTFWDLFEYQLNIDLAVARGGFHLALPFDVVVAIDSVTALGAMGTVARHLIAIDNIRSDAYQFFILIQKTQSIAVMQGFIGQQLHLDRVTPFHLTDVLAHRLGGERRSDVRLAAIDEIIGEASVEGLFGIHLEIIGAMPQRGLHKFRASFKDGIQLLAIISRHVFHIIGILQAPFYLEACDAGI